MDGAFTPIAIAQAVARNIVPLVGILVFHWSTGNVLLLYLLDTLLSMAVIFAGLMSTFSRPSDNEGVGGWINSEAGYVLMGLFVAAFIAVPLGMPVGIMLAASGFSFREAFNDSSLRGGALLQTVVALWSYIELYRALRTYSPAQLKLRQRFALVLMRWLVVMMVTYFILDILPPSKPVLLLLVVAYIAGSIFAEIAPDRFLRAMPGGADNLEPDASSVAGPADRRGSRNRDRRGKR
jgi:Family of unknown function (DUF6498)